MLHAVFAGVCNQSMPCESLNCVIQLILFLDPVIYSAGNPVWLKYGWAGLNVGLHLDKTKASILYKYMFRITAYIGNFIKLMLLYWFDTVRWIVFVTCIMLNNISRLYTYTHKGQLGAVGWLARLPRNVEVVGSRPVNGPGWYLQHETYCLVLVVSRNGFELK